MEHKDVNTAAEIAGYPRNDDFDIKSGVSLDNIDVDVEQVAIIKLFEDMGNETKHAILDSKDVEEAAHIITAYLTDSDAEPKKFKTFDEIKAAVINGFRDIQWTNQQAQLPVQGYSEDELHEMWRLCSDSPKFSNEW